MRSPAPDGPARSPPGGDGPPGGDAVKHPTQPEMNMTNLVEIDGAFGEGGGQIVRSSLSLSILNQRPCRIRDIRANRRKPGLLRQHLTAARAAAAICNGRLVGAELGSREIELYPGEPRGGEFEFAVGTAGSALLVLQTILPPLLKATTSSRVSLQGGTHNPAAPSFDFIDRVFLPALRRMGARVEVRLVRPGFFPAGGGEVMLEIEPSALSPIALLERGPISHRRAIVRSAKLSPRVAKRELRALQDALSWPDECFAIEEVDNSIGPGNVVLIEVGNDAIREITAGYGRQGVPGNRVVKEAVQPMRSYLASDAPVGRHLADQLLIPAAIAGGARFRTVAPSDHTRTNAAVIREFEDTSVAIEQQEDRTWEIRIAR